MGSSGSSPAGARDAWPTRGFSAARRSVDLRRARRGSGLVAVALILALGVFRGGALLPSDRSIVAVAMLAWGVAFALTAVSGGTSGSDAWRWLSAWDLALSARVAFLGLVSLSVWTLMSALWSPDPGRSAWVAVVYAGGVIAFWAGRQIMETRWSGVPLVLPVLGIVGAVVSWASLVAFGLEWYGWVGELQGVKHAQGPFGYANALAGLIVLTLPVTAVGVWISRRMRPLTLLFLGSVALQTCALALTRSRGALLALAGAMTLYLVIWSVRRIWGSRATGRVRRLPVRRVLLVVVLSAAAVAIVAASVAYGAGRLRDPDPNTDQMRLQTWRAGLRAAAERPVIGWGADMWYEAYEPFRSGPATRFAHSALVQHATELGGVGVTLWALTACAIVATGSRRLWRGAASISVSLADPALWLGVATTAFLLHSLVDLTWYVPALFYLLWVCTGAIAACTRECPSRPPQVADTGNPPKGVM